MQIILQYQAATMILGWVLERFGVNDKVQLVAVRVGLRFSGFLLFLCINSSVVFWIDFSRFPNNHQHDKKWSYPSLGHIIRLASGPLSYQSFITGNFTGSPWEKFFDTLVIRQDNSEKQPLVKNCQKATRLLKSDSNAVLEFSNFLFIVRLCQICIQN